MLNKTVLKQTARRKIWVNLVFTFSISIFALSFMPFLYEDLMAWFVGILIFTYIFVHFGMVLRSRITMDKGSNYIISIPDHYSNTSCQIPIQYITSIETCEYRSFKKDRYYPEGVNKDYYYRKKLLGYLGAGLIVCYQLPQTMTGDSIVRGVRFPAPKANEFVKFIKENIQS